VVVQGRQAEGNLLVNPARGANAPAGWYLGGWRHRRSGVGDHFHPILVIFAKTAAEDVATWHAPLM
jgi:hypothetical protein